MRRYIVLGLLLCFNSILLAGTDMIANIDEPVTTEFGTYVPYRVIGKPAVDSYSIAVDFSNVKNFNDYKAFFNESELNLLRQNHFVVTPRRPANTLQATGHREIYDIYNECREQGTPILITSDAMLHTLHLLFDRILKTMEEKRFFGDLLILVQNLIATTQSQDNHANLPAVKAALKRNTQFLSIAITLLDRNHIVSMSDPVIQKELTLIFDHSRMSETSPLFGYQEDYTQYQPRGHYSKSDSLQSYFQAMMWLGRMTFPIDPEWSLSAILLLSALSQTEFNGRPALQLWENIYWPTVFMVGKSDDIDLYTYDRLIRQIYGENYANLAPDILADSTRLAKLMIEADSLPEPKIGEGLEKPKGFRFMGQRFIPDSWIFDQLVFNNVPCRFWPRGLDAMTALGSERAYELLKTHYNEFVQCPSYKDRLDSLKRELAGYASATWAQNLYWNWLYCLMPLYMEKGTGWPTFMQSKAWCDKDLLAALASWAELRHDTILYAKQSGTERGMPDANALVQGYVEPNAYLYARLAALVSYFIAGLNERSLLFDDFRIYLTDIKELMLALKHIAEKEWTNRSLSVADYDLIANIGSRLQALATFTPMTELENADPGTDPMPVIADVHSEYNSQKVLEVAVGFPYSIYAIVPIEGQLKITKGAAFSYYEFKNQDRLTDENWRDLLASSFKPALPEWSQSYVAGDATLNLKPEIHRWEHRGMIYLSVTCNADTFQMGEVVHVTIRSYKDNPTHPISLTETPWVTLVNPDGSAGGNFQVLAGPDGYYSTIPTQGLAAGPYWIQVKAKAAELADRTIEFRTGFYLTSTTAGVSSNTVPHSFALHQNYPNPFNPGTTITFDLPSPGRIEIEIYNMLGQRVRKLINAYASAGSHTIQWDGNDDHGFKVGSGIYYCHLRALAKNNQGFENIIKMILIR